MICEPPATPPPELPPQTARAEVPALPPTLPRPDGTRVIDLTRLVPPQPAEPCPDEPADPFNSQIVVCAATGPSPRLGPMVGPVDDGFGSAIPRAKIKLSDTATAEANVHNAPVGGINANGGEVRVKIDF